MNFRNKADIDPAVLYKHGAVSGATRFLRGTMSQRFYRPVGEEMGKRSREKGCAFERRVAKEILIAAAPLGVAFKDCYRTPMSGGHPGADAGDLCISPQLQKLLPWCIECKHYANWQPYIMVRPRQQEMTWLKQAITAADKMKKPPLVVMSGNHTGIYAAGRYEDMCKVYPEFDRWAPSVLFDPSLNNRTFTLEEPTWLMVDWEDFTYKLNEAALAATTLPKVRRQ